MIYVGSAKGTKYGMKEEKLYDHKLGWYVLRAKDSTLALNIARNMRIACQNPHLWYSQAKRLEINQRGVNATVKTAGDCSSTVRACIQASGHNVPNFTTATEVTTLVGTGLFEKLNYDKNKLRNGDILVTKSKGHTVVVTQGATIPLEKPLVAVPTIKNGTRGTNAMRLQADLNYIGIASLTQDGIIGQNSIKALKDFQKKYGLTVDGIYGKKSYAKMQEVVK